MQKSNNARILRIITFAILLLTCGMAICYNISGVTMASLVKEFSLEGSTRSGLMNTFTNIGSLLVLITIPLFQGRVHKVFLIIAGSVLQVVTLVLTGISGSFPMLLLAMTLFGMGNNLADTCGNSYVVDLYPENNAKYLSMLHAAFGIGGLLAPVILNPVLNSSSWRITYFVCAGVFAAVNAVFIILALRNYKKTDSCRMAAEARITGKVLADYISRPRNLMILGAAIFYGGAQLGITGWVSYYIENRFGNADMGSACLSVYWITATVSRLIAPKIPLPPKKLLIYGTAVAGVAHLLGVISGSAVAMLIATGVIGIASGLFIPMLVAEAARGNESCTSLSTSAVFLLMCASRMVMPLMMGAASAKSIAAAMIIPAVATLLAAGCCFFATVFEKKHKI